MAGPYPPNPGMGSAGYPPPMAPYLAPPPPAAPYPRPPRRRLLVGSVLAAVTALGVAVGFLIRGGPAPAQPAGSPITAASAETAIQHYLNALVDRDIDTVARNTLCGIYDDVADHRSDNAVAKMSSDAFRKQFGQAEVISIDKVVYLSDRQAQALFTMRVSRVGGEQRNDRVQGLAQLLSVDGHVLVCSYVLRAAGTF